LQRQSKNPREKSIADDPASLDLDAVVIIIGGLASMLAAIPSAEKAEENLRRGEVSGLFRAF